MADIESPQLQNLSLTDLSSSSPPTELVPTPSTRASASSPALDAPNFVDLPPEVLKLIFKHAFSSYVGDPDSYDEQSGKVMAWKLSVASPRYTLGDRSKNLEDDYRMPWYDSLTRGYPHLGLPHNTLALLRVCNKLYEIGAPVFYGLYTFQTTSAESFRLLFTKHIGPTNLGAIRKLVIGLPHGVKTMPSKYIGRYTRMLDCQMPQLQEFKITTKFGRWYSPVTLDPTNTWIENHRGMLWFAAWVTRSHPLLKCAAWDEKNTVYANTLDDERWAQFDNRPPVELSITLYSVKPENVHVMKKPQEIEARNAGLEALYGEPKPDDLGHLFFEEIDHKSGLPYEVQTVPPATQILLDSWKIRRKGFVGLSTRETCRPYAYQLATTATDSEVHRPLESEMADQVLLEEMLLHNKIPQTTIAKLSGAKLSIHMLRLRAKVLENKKIEEEMFMKRGEPPTEPTEHWDEPTGEDWNGNHTNADWANVDDGNNEWGGDNDGNEGDGNDTYGDGWSGYGLPDFDNSDPDEDSDDYEDDFDGYSSHEGSEDFDDDQRAADEGQGNAMPGSWGSGQPDNDVSDANVVDTSTGPIGW